MGKNGGQFFSSIVIPAANDKDHLIFIKMWFKIKYKNQSIRKQETTKVPPRAAASSLRLSSYMASKNENRIKLWCKIMIKQQSSKSRTTDFPNLDQQ